MIEVLMMGSPGGEGQPNSLAPMLIMWALILGIFYVFMLRPQRKKQQQTAKMLAELKRGDRVLTTSGLYGTVDKLKDNVAVIKIAEQVKVEMAKSAITTVVDKAN